MTNNNVNQSNVATAHPTAAELRGITNQMKDENFMDSPLWQYDEISQVGIDYADTSQVTAYDSTENKLRDIKREIEDIMNYLVLTKYQTVLDFGTGTGEFALEAAKYSAEVFAVDVSHAMLEHVHQKAKLQGLTNIQFHHAGFLTYEHLGEPLNAVVSQYALHHLPDFWKMVALRRIYKMLNNKGKLYLRDIVYSFKVDNYNIFFNNLIEKIKESAGEIIAQDKANGIRNEFPTFDWVMEELLEKAGFCINKADYYDDFIAVYMCTKKTDTDS